MAAGKKIIPLRPARRPEANARPDATPLTLANITAVTWKDKDAWGQEIERTVTGAQIATLLTIAAEKGHDDGTLAGDTGSLGYKLRGLSVLVFPDAGESRYQDDARALVSDYLEHAAALVNAHALGGDYLAKKYSVTLGGKA